MSKPIFTDERRAIRYLAHFTVAKAIRHGQLAQVQAALWRKQQGIVATPTAATPAAATPAAMKPAAAKASA